MLERNASIKTAPERWQDRPHVDFDVVVTFEQRVFDRVVEDLQSRSTRTLQPVLVVNLETKDNHSEAAAAAPLTLKLCEYLRAEEDWEDEIETIVQKFSEDTGKHVLYTVHFG